MKLQVLNVKHLITQLERYKTKTLPKKIDEKLKFLAKIIRDKTDRAYHTHRRRKHRSVNVTVSHVTIEGENRVITVSANGEAVVFLEFGAGDMAGAFDGGNYDMVMAENGIIITPGSYSVTLGLGGQDPPVHPNYAYDEYWLFNGQKYTYIEPTRGLYRAVQEAIARYVETTQEGQG